MQEYNLSFPISEPNLPGIEQDIWEKETWCSWMDRPTIMTRNQTESWMRCVESWRKYDSLSSYFRLKCKSFKRNLEFQLKQFLCSHQRFLMCSVEPKAIISPQLIRKEGDFIRKWKEGRLKWRERMEIEIKCWGSSLFKAHITQPTKTYSKFSKSSQWRL